MLIALAIMTASLSITFPVKAEEVRKIAITFDDAPTGEGPLYSGAERTRELVSALEQAGVEGAMFFVTTQNLSRAEEGRSRLQAYVENGHRLANHSHSHLWLWQTEPEEYVKDAETAANILQEFEGASPSYRFPYLDEGRSEEKRDAVREWLRGAGLVNGYVTIDNYDWYMNALFAEAIRSDQEVDFEAWRDAYVEILVNGVEFYDEIARGSLGRSPSHVLLLHENDLAALFIDDLATALRANGWEIVPAVDAYLDPIASIEPDTLFNGQGRIAAIAHANGTRTVRELVSPYESERWLRNEFVRRGLLTGSGG